MTVELDESVMRTLRERRGLEPDDESLDAELRQTKPANVVRELVAWELGDGEWANIIAGYMRDAGAKPEDFDV